jgi:hypothetical protein
MIANAAIRAFGHHRPSAAAIPGEYLFPLFLPFLEEQRTIFSQPPHEKGECNT